MSTTNIKKFRFVTGFDGDENFVVVLEVDMNVLTSVIATEINNFWSGSKDRAAGKDAINVVLRLFGQSVVRLFLAEGGVFFSEQSGKISAPIWSEQLRAMEGWGGENGTPYGWCGIRVLSAECELPDFDDSSVCEVLL